MQDASPSTATMLLQDLQSLRFSLSTVDDDGQVMFSSQNQLSTKDALLNLPG
jgi:hypothetical protein